MFVQFVESHQSINNHQPILGIIELQTMQEDRYRIIIEVPTIETIIIIITTTTTITQHTIVLIGEDQHLRVNRDTCSVIYIVNY